MDSLTIVADHPDDIIYLLSVLMMLLWAVVWIVVVLFLFMRSRRTACFMVVAFLSFVFASIWKVNAGIALRIFARLFAKWRLLSCTIVSPGLSRSLADVSVLRMFVVFMNLFCALVESCVCVLLGDND